MTRKHPPMSGKELARRLEREGWEVSRKGPGDHVQYRHPDKPGRRVTVDKGAKDIPPKTLMSAFRQAGWEW